MANNTTNYNLVKPLQTESYNIDVQNGNMDIIDGTLKGHATQLSDLTNDRIYYCGTTSGTNTYAATNSKITAYTDGLTIRVKIGTASTAASTLNINSLGAKTILDSLGNTITSGGLKVGLPYQLCYNGTNFIVLGKGGGGDATAAQLLLSKKATVDGGPIVGTMPNNGALGGALAINGSYAIPTGYTTGGTVTQSITTKAAANYNPSTVAQTIAASQYLSGDQTIAAVGGTAGPGDVVSGKTFSSASGINQNGTATVASLGGKYYQASTVAYLGTITLPFTPSIICVESSGGTTAVMIWYKNSLELGGNITNKSGGVAQAPNSAIAVSGNSFTWKGSTSTGTYYAYA